MKQAALAGLGVLCLGLNFLSGVTAAQEATGPAELPPASYAGLQYVDSKGCLFMRAGQPGNENWLPRVTRDGKPLCDYPPSGQRVPVAGAATSEEEVPVEGAPPGAATAGYYVAVGSFGVASNADKAEARLKALKYPTLRGRVAGGDSPMVTVYAGPFADAAAASQARDELRAVAFPDALVIGP